MKIFFYGGNQERESLLNKRIAEQLKIINPSAEIRVSYGSYTEMIDEIIEFNPDRLFTYPQTGYLNCWYNTLLKYAMGFSVICFATEGAFSGEVDSETTLMFAGVSEHSIDLIDIEIFWGGLSASVLGGILLKSKKLYSEEQIFVTGYPLYEDYFNNVTKHLPKGLNAEDYNVVSRFRESPVFLFASSFVSANYDRELVERTSDIINYNDPNRDKKADIITKECGLDREFREKFIGQLIEASKENKDSLFVLKLHPWEVNHKVRAFDKLKEYDNILVVDYNMQIAAIIKNISMFFHVGSTTAAEAYMAQKPTCHIIDSDIVDYCENNVTMLIDSPFKVFCPSTIIRDVTELNETIREFKRGEIVFREIKKANKALLDYFNIDFENNQMQYTPSYDTAKIILSDFEKHSIKSDDSYLLEIVNSEFCANFINNLIFYAANNYPKDNSLRILKKLAPILEDRTMGAILMELCDCGEEQNKFEISIKKYLFYSTIPVLYETKKSKNIYIFGAGSGGSKLLEKLKYCDTGKIINVLGFFDNGKGNEGKLIDGYRVLLPDAERINNCDYVIIASNWEEDIYTQLINMDIDKEKLVLDNKAGFKIYEALKQALKINS